MAKENVGENVGENLDEILETRIKSLWTDCSPKKIKKIVVILHLMLDNPHISADELKEELGLANRSVERYIADLKKRGIIERQGPDKGGLWKVLV